MPPGFQGQAALIAKGNRLGWNAEQARGDEERRARGLHADLEDDEENCDIQRNRSHDDAR